MTESKATAELAAIRTSPAYHFCRVLLERQMPFRSADRAMWRVRLGHLSSIIARTHGARVEPSTWAVAFSDLGVPVALTRGGTDFTADVCESHALDWVPQSWNACDCTDRFAWVSDMPAELDD